MLKLESTLSMSFGDKQERKACHAGWNLMWKALRRIGRGEVGVDGSEAWKSKRAFA
jgi:hypothetical protein